MMPAAKNIDTDVYLDGETDREFKRFVNNAFFTTKPHILLPRLYNLLPFQRKFSDKQIETRFATKKERVKTAQNLGVPDRVPVITSGLNFYTPTITGITVKDFCFDTKLMKSSVSAFIDEYPEFDSIFPCHFNYGVARIARFLKTDLVSLPGIDLPENVSYQFIEKERFKAVEYDDIAKREMDFILDVVLPRLTPLYKQGKGFSKIDRLRLYLLIAGIAVVFKDVIEMMEKEKGVPLQGSACFFTPFDVVSLLRGLGEISKDLFQRPAMIEKTVELFIPMLFVLFESACVLSGRNSINLMVERSFSLSPRQFQKFCLPTIQTIVNRLAKQGILCNLFLEAEATQHLESFLELPPRKFVLHIDKSDIVKAKKVLGGHACIVGNVPIDLLVAGSPEKVKDYCKMLLQEVAPGGGFMMSGALGIPDNAKHANIRAMIEYTIENGRY